MGVKRVINSVQVVPMGMANAFLIEGQDGLTLIDAGFPGKEAAVFHAIRGLGRSPDHLKHLIFTHGHPDHIGSAAAIVRETRAKTYMHPLDIPLAESGGPFRPMRPAPGLLGQVLCRLFFDPDKRMEPVAIDQPLSDGEILPIAGGIEAIHTPGHCAGHVALRCSINSTNPVRTNTIKNCRRTAILQSRFWSMWTYIHKCRLATRFNSRHSMQVRLDCCNVGAPACRIDLQVFHNALNVIARLSQ